MDYYKISQPVPGKGMAWTYYEVTDTDKIQRILTFIPESNEITLYPKPKMKTLFQPEKLIPSDQSEFEEIWANGENARG